MSGSNWNRPTLPQLVDQTQSDIESRLDGADARVRRNNLDVMARVFGAGLDGLYDVIAGLVDQMFPQTATAAYLDLHASLRKVFRKLPAPAIGTGIATGPNGAVLPAGTSLQRSDQALFVTAADVTIVAGTANVTIVAVLGGTSGNTAAGAKLTIVTAVPGIVSTVTVAAGGISDGTDTETDAELQARLLQVWQEQPQGGAPFDYVERAEQVAGVTRAWVFPLWVGLGTVGVSFVMDDQVGSIFPDDNAVALVQSYLTDPSWKPVGATLTTFAPVAAPVNFTIQLAPDTDALRAAVTAALAKLIAQDQSIAGAYLPPDGTATAGVIKLGRMWSSITGAIGEGDATLVSPAADFVAARGHLPVLGTVTFE